MFDVSVVIAGVVFDVFLPVWVFLREEIDPGHRDVA